MRPTIKLGRILGIDVGAHWSVLVVVALWTYLLTGGTGPAEFWVAVIAAIVTFLASLLAHELAHAIVARRNGISVRGITLWLLGGVAQLASPIPTAAAQFRVAAVGPATSFVISGLCFALQSAGHTLGLDPLVVWVFTFLAWTNLVLAVFNLIPAAPLDGGRLLASVLWVATGDRTRAEVGATRAGQVVGATFMVAGVLGTVLHWPFTSLWTVIMGWFVYNAATAEQRYARATGALGDRRVGDVAAPLTTTSGSLSIEQFLDQLSPQAALRPVFAVEDEQGAIVGVTSLEQVLGVGAADRSAVRVQDLAVPLSLVPTAGPDEYLVHVVDRIGRGVLPCLMVVRDGMFAGLLAPSDLVPAPKPVARAA